MAEGKGRVCVTGGTGFIASMMIKRLLSNDYYVNTTTRSAPVHVDDVAKAHIFMIEHPNPKGRYICSLSGNVSIEEIVELVHEKYPEFQIPTLDTLKDIKGERMPRLNSKKLIDAGFEYNYGTKEIFDEAIQCCKANGYL